MITINAGDNSTRLLSGGGRREIRDQPKNKKKKCRNVQGGLIYDLFLMIMIMICFSDQRESREFSRIFLKIHFSISILSHLIFTFTSRSRFWVIWFSLSLLEKSEGRKFFTFHFSKMVKSFHISLFLLRKMSGIECNSSWIDWEFFLHQQLNSSILIFGSFKIQQRTIQKSVFFWTLLSQIMNLISKLLVKSRLLSAKRAEATEFTTRCMCWKEAVTKNSNFATLVYCQG